MSSSPTCEASRTAVRLMARMTSPSLSPVAALTEGEEQEIRGPILDKYEREGSPYYSTARLWDDGILDPAQTRTALALAISAAYNAPIPPAKFGVFRM